MLTLSLGLTSPAARSEDFAVKTYDMRGDNGTLEDFGPGGVSWSPEGFLLVADSHYNVFHLFDTVGRRYRFMKPIRNGPTARYEAVAALEGRQFLAAGSHFQPNHDFRLASDHSVIHRMDLESIETFSKDSAKENLSPDGPLRVSGYYGDSVEKPMDLQGLACDPPTNRVFFGCASPVASDGSVLILEGQLDKLLAHSQDLKLKVLPTELKPEKDSLTDGDYFLSDLTYVPNEGLAILMTSQSHEAKRFGANQIWYMKGGAQPAKLVQRDLSPGNRATGLALRPTSKGEYQAAIVCDNNYADTKIPSRLVMLQGVRLPQR